MSKTRFDRGKRGRKNKSTKTYPDRLSSKDLVAFLEQDLGIKNLQSDAITHLINLHPRQFRIPNPQYYLI